jgi:hypothetical protein
MGESKKLGANASPKAFHFPGQAYVAFDPEDAGHVDVAAKMARQHAQDGVVSDVAQAGSHQPYYDHPKHKFDPAKGFGDSKRRPRLIR